MATKAKATAEQENKEITEAVETVTEETAKPAEEQDPWKKLVKVRPPRLMNSGIDHYYVCVNDIRYQIPADGREYEVPEPIALVLMDSIEAEYKAEDYAKEVEKNSYDPVLKPKPMD